MKSDCFESRVWLRVQELNAEAWERRDAEKKQAAERKAQCRAEAKTRALAAGAALTACVGGVVGFFALVTAVDKANSAERLERVRILRCYDGDTCTTTTGERIRLACIDTPELRGKRADPVPAKAARDYVRSLVVGRDVNLRRITRDRWGRTVGELFVDGTNVQKALVRAGHASIYWRFAHQCPWIR